MAKYKKNQEIWWTAISDLIYNFLYLNKPIYIGLLNELKNNQIDRNSNFIYTFYQFD